MKIAFEHVFPPIPCRDYDWSALDDDTYCGCEECHYPVGYGRTRLAALLDLWDQMVDRMEE